MNGLVRYLAGFACAIMLTVAESAAVASSDQWRSAEQMTESAQGLIRALEPDQRDKIQFPLDAAERGAWSNLPVVMVPRPGLYLSQMNAHQRKALHALLRASLSSQGYAKFTGVMRLEELLHDLAAARYANLPEEERSPLARAFIETYRYDNYAAAIFGDPTGSEWGWQLTGHHAAANFTVSRGRVAFTPTFLGSSPMVVESGPYAGAMALPQEGSRGVELMRALSAEQQQKAQVSTELVDGIFEGPGRKSSLSAHEGLKASELSNDQKRLMRALVEEYVGNADFDVADAQLALIEAAGWDELWFSWRGSVDMSDRFYYRVHGPRLLIEYNRQDANHDHMIVRDPVNDYGDDWLGRHLREHHPSMEEAMEHARHQANVEEAQER